MPFQFSGKVQRVWDAVDSHISQHKRKYAALGFILLVLPRSVPPLWNVIHWLWVHKPEWIATIAMPGFSWDWVTVPLGLLLLGRIWWQTRHEKPEEPPAHEDLKQGERDEPIKDGPGTAQDKPGAADLLMSFVPYQNVTLIEVRTMNPEGVSDVTLTVLSLKRWSEADPKGWCRANEFENAPKPVRLQKHGGGPVLYVHAPWTFSILGEKNVSRWVIPYRPFKGSAAVIHLPFDKWRMEVNLESRGESRIETFYFENAEAKSSALIAPPSP